MRMKSSGGISEPPYAAVDVTSRVGSRTMMNDRNTTSGLMMRTYRSRSGTKLIL